MVSSFIHYMLVCLLTTVLFVIDSSMNPIDVNTKFDLVPDTATGTKRAVMIGINYVGDSPGELSGCWNDVLNMKKYIMDV